MTLETVCEQQESRDRSVVTCSPQKTCNEMEERQFNWIFCQKHDNELVILVLKIVLTIMFLTILHNIVPNNIVYELGQLAYRYNFHLPYLTALSIVYPLEAGQSLFLFICCCFFCLFFLSFWCRCTHDLTSSVFKEIHLKWSKTHAKSWVYMYMSFIEEIVDFLDRKFNDAFVPRAHVSHGHFEYTCTHKCHVAWHKDKS